MRTLGPVSLAGQGTGQGVAPSSLSALHVAVFQERLDKLQDLLERSGELDIDGRDTFGQTPLFLACYKSSKDMVSLLVKHGASLSLKDCNGNSLLHVSCGVGAVEMVSLLLDLSQQRAGVGEGKEPVDLRVLLREKNKEGKTALDVAKNHCPAYNRASMVGLIGDALRDWPLAEKADTAASLSSAVASSPGVENASLLTNLTAQISALSSGLGTLKADLDASRRETQPQQPPEQQQQQMEGRAGGPSLSAADESLLALMRCKMVMADEQKVLIDRVQAAVQRLEDRLGGMEKRIAQLERKGQEVPAQFGDRGEGNHSGRAQAPPPTPPNTTSGAAAGSPLPAPMRAMPAFMTADTSVPRPPLFSEPPRGGDTGAEGGMRVFGLPRPS